MNVRSLYVVRQTFLIISVVYFFVVAIGISRHWSLGALEGGWVFAVMGGLFLVAMMIEVAVEWWNHRTRILWGLLAVSTYAVIGFVAAPRLYGDSAIVIAMAFPIVAVFFGGFIFVFVKLFVRAFHRRETLTPAYIMEALNQMPGWVFHDQAIEKRFRFDNLEQAKRFAEACLVVGATFYRRPVLQLYQTDVAVRINTPDLRGVTKRDLAFAKEIDQR